MKPHQLQFLAAALMAAALSTALSGTAAAQTPYVKAWNILNTAVSAPNLERRTGSVAALGIITHDAHAEELATTALGDDKPEVRTSAAAALGDMQATGSIPALAKALSDPDPSVVLAAARSLLTLKDKQAYDVYYAVLTGERKSGVGLLASQKKMLDDPKKMAQFGLQTGVGFLPFGGMGLTAMRMLTKDDASPVRAAAAKFLANDPDPKSGEALLTAASDKSWIVRAAALEAIALRGDRSLAGKIEPQLDDERDVVQYAAAAAIIRLNNLPSTPIPSTPRRRTRQSAAPAHPQGAVQP